MRAIGSTVVEDDGREQLQLRLTLDSGPHVRGQVRHLVYDSRIPTDLQFKDWLAVRIKTNPRPGGTW